MFAVLFFTFFFSRFLKAFQNMDNFQQSSFKCHYQNFNRAWLTELSVKVSMDKCPRFRQLLIYESEVKLATQSLPFRLLLHQGVGEDATSFPVLFHFTLDMYLILLSIKQAGIKYHFQCLWYDMTWNWTQVSQTISKLLIYNHCK